MVMQKMTIFLSYLFATSFIYSGTLFHTLVQTPYGLKEIQDLNIGDEVISADRDFVKHAKSILTITDSNIECHIEITMDNDAVLKVSPDQKLFIPYKWIQADQLSLGDVLLKSDATFVRIKAICIKNESSTLRFITVADYENFFASTNGVLIHNDPIAGAIGYWVTKTLCYGTAVAAVGTIVVASGGTAGAAVGAITAATTAGAPIGATIVGGAIAGAGLAQEAVLITTAVTSSAGSLAGTVAAVETASTLVGSALTLCLFLP
ncbi:MAG: polymorphic toxin-type HINT domain-containing protein [Candidatus Dependentiae bacterium]|nr:polymorphic toxin-type HINT domain-containing protein [Candidatus Dependentiae bacterium]